MKNVNEGTTSFLTVTFLNKNGVAETPSSASYSIKTEDGVAIRAETAIGGLAGTVELTLTSVDNRIVNSLKQNEIHVVTIVGVYGSSSDKVTSEYRYQVNNLMGLSGNPVAFE